MTVISPSEGSKDGVPSGAAIGTDFHIPEEISKHAPEKNRSDQQFTESKETLKQWFTGAIDQGTTSSRFIIFNGLGEPVASHQIEFEQIYPESGCV
jgi:glycerol kinase